MGKDKENSGLLEKAFNTFVGCAQVLGTLVAILGFPIAFIGVAWAITHQDKVAEVVRTISREPTATPMVITLHTDTPLPTYTLYPTYTPYLESPTSTPYPTYTPYPKPTSTPTPRPILVSLPFEDDFDMGPKPEWEPIRGAWRMVDGKYTADASKDWSMTFVGDVGWTDYVVDVDVFSFNRQYPVRIIVRAQDGSYMVLQTKEYDTDWIIVSEGSSSVIAHSDKGGLTHGWRNWHKDHLRVEVKGNIYTAYGDEGMLLRVQDTSFTNGRVGLAFTYPTENTTRFDDFQITELR